MRVWEVGENKHRKGEDDYREGRGEEEEYEGRNDDGRDSVWNASESVQFPFPMPPPPIPQYNAADWRLVGELHSRRLWSVAEKKMKHNLPSGNIRCFCDSRQNEALMSASHELIWAEGVILI